MTKENMTDLLYTKFMSSNKDRQKKLMGFLLGNLSEQDKIVDFLNGKNLKNEEKNYKEQDYIYVPFDISSYPKINKKYYEDNELIVNNLYIRVLVSYINPVTGYTGIQVVTENSDEESVIDVYPSYIPNQKQIALM